MKKLEYTRFGNYEHFIYEEDIKPPWAFWLGVAASVATILGLPLMIYSIIFLKG